MKISRSFGTYFTLLAIFAVLYSCDQGSSNASVDNASTPTTAVKDAKPTKKKTLGEKVFITCAACHSLKEGDAHKVGPNLHGIFGKKAGTSEGFKYSEAMVKSDIVWSEEIIREWLQKPTDFLPGTTMAFVGIQKKEHQDALIEYLKKETK